MILISQTGPASGPFWNYERDSGVFAKYVLAGADVTMTVVGHEPGCPLTFVELFVAPPSQRALPRERGGGVDVKKNLGEMLREQPQL